MTNKTTTLSPLLVVGLGRKVMRPGVGWKHIAGAVYEHSNGSRVHLLGMIRLPSGDWVSANKWPESKDAARFVRMNGGNWKRGLMAWALTYNVQDHLMTDSEAGGQSGAS